jgi:hypothetical protein
MQNYRFGDYGEEIPPEVSAYLKRLIAAARKDTTFEDGYPMTITVSPELVAALLAAPMLDFRLPRLCSDLANTLLERLRSRKWSFFSRLQAREILRRIRDVPGMDAVRLHVIDPIAGGGLDALAFQLEDPSCEVYAGDLRPPETPIQTAIAVVKRTALETLRAGNAWHAVLLLIWQYAIDEGVLEGFEGDHVVHVGDGGCTYGYQREAFRARDVDGEPLEGEHIVQPWLETPIPMLKYPGISDHCTLYRRNPAYTAGIHAHYSELTGDEIEAEHEAKKAAKEFAMTVLAVVPW